MAVRGFLLMGKKGRQFFYFFFFIPSSILRMDAKDNVCESGLMSYCFK